MAKKLLLPILIIFVLFLSFISAINIKIEKENPNEVMIKEIHEPIEFKLKVTNLGATTDFYFYNLLGIGMEPSGEITIRQSETKEITLNITARDDMNYEGFYAIKYFIRGGDNSQIEDKLNLEIVSLRNEFEIGAQDFNPESSSLKLFIKNKKDYNFKEMNVKFKSAFFDVEQKFSLLPFEKKEIEIQLNKEDYKKLMAGFYTMSAEVVYLSQPTKIEGVINFVEKNIVVETKKDYGLVVSTKNIKKINEGNVVVKSETTIKKNIISRLFTSFSPEPDSVERKGAVVYYTWKEEIKPGESFEIIVKTNWLFPFIIILLIIAIVVLVKKSSSTDVVLRKRVSFVKSKGGEFALKVSVIVSAKKYVENVKIVDRLPPLVKIYGRFGSEVPVKIDEKNRRVEWNFPKLEEGEVRAISYIVYSRVGVLGKFALPSATAIYEKDGKVHESISNRAFFIAEQRTRDLEEE